MHRYEQSFDRIGVEDGKIIRYNKDQERYEYGSFKTDELIELLNEKEVLIENLTVTLRRMHSTLLLMNQQRKTDPTKVEPAIIEMQTEVISALFNVQSHYENH